MWVNYWSTAGRGKKHCGQQQGRGRLVLLPLHRFDHKGRIGGCFCKKRNGAGQSESRIFQRAGKTSKDYSLSNFGIQFERQNTQAEIGNYRFRQPVMLRFVFEIYFN